MAVELPSQFLDQDYDHEASSLSLNKSENTNTWSSFGSSDSGSVFSSTETESEESEEDYMAELTRQMAHYMLQDDNNHHHDHHKQEKESSFWPAVPLGSNQESPKFQSKQALIDDKIKSIQYYKLELKQDQQQVIDPQSSNPDKRVIFLEGSGSKTKSSGGTGVFLPQGIGNASVSRKKQGCSTVLIPARVVQALKQHFDKVGVPSRFNGLFPLQQNDRLMELENNSSSGLNSQRQRPAPTPTPAPALNHQEIALPQEWTY